MNAKFYSILILASALIAAKADEHLAVLQVGSDVYSNVTVTSVSATDVYFTFTGGMANVKIEKLSPDLQRHFSFDPEKAKEAEIKQAESQAKYHDQLMHQPVVRPPNTTQEALISAKSNGPEPVPLKKLWAKSFLNQRAPDLIVEKWLTPEPNRRGKFTLIDFWATWCPPCRQAIPELNGYYEKFGDKLVVIGISDETEEAVRKLVNPQIEYAVAIDTQARTKKQSK